MFVLDQETNVLPVSTLCDESPAGLHLDIQPSLHGAHLHVLMQVAVHVALGCGQLQLRRRRRRQTVHGDVFVNANVSFSSLSYQTATLQNKFLRPGEQSHVTLMDLNQQSFNMRSKSWRKLYCWSLLWDLTSIWSMVSWYSFSLDLNRHSVSLITSSMDSSWGCGRNGDRFNNPAVASGCAHAKTVKGTAHASAWLSRPNEYPGKSSHSSRVSSVSSQARLSQSSSNSHSLLEEKHMAVGV